jgi:hypothetical protein
MAEAAFDALAADLTVPQPRPLVDLERDEYADLEVAEPMTVPFVREEQEVETTPIARTRGWWNAQHTIAALVTVVAGFGLGAGVALLIV